MNIRLEWMSLSPALIFKRVFEARHGRSGSSGQNRFVQ